MLNFFRLFLFKGPVRSRLYFLTKLKITGCKKNAVIVEGGVNVHHSARIRFNGEGNKLRFGRNVNVKDVRVTFSGNNAELTIGDDCMLNGSFVLESDCSISIGRGTKFNSRGSRINCGEPKTHVRIGDGCLLSDVKMRTSDQHSIIDMDLGLRTNPAKDIHIENRVWIAEDVYIYKGGKVGAGSIVGARATVTGKLPANSLCLGTPAKAVRSGVTWQDEPLVVFKKDKSKCQELA